MVINKKFILGVLMVSGVTKCSALREELDLAAGRQLYTVHLPRVRVEKDVGGQVYGPDLKP